ncbi:MAG: hypothetical protein DSY76_08220 [Bacteroidetes bacterium]|nr:MAG: hypothetical protein DSY76_08220 [Bacteroidota bacterium]
MQKIVLVIVLSITYLVVSCNDVDSKNIDNAKKTKVSINISNINQDSTFFEYNINNIQKDSLIFKFPKVIPGAYRINNSGKYIMHLSCFDNNSKKLDYKKLDNNSYLIYKSKSLKTIRYYVKNANKTDIYEVLTKLIVTDSFCLINPISVIGYFDEYKEVKHSLKIEKPINFFTNYKLSNNSISNPIDKFEYNSYFDLVENPLLYGKLDTNSLPIYNASISVYSDNKIITSQLIKSWIKPLMGVLTSYTSESRDKTIPYRFNFIFTDNVETSSALEQKNASTYCLKANWDTLFLKREIQHMISHEFLHIITPIGFQSNTYKKELFCGYSSEHLWLYEGVVEYLSLKTRLDAEVYTPKSFIIALSHLNSLNMALDKCNGESILKLSENILSKDDFVCFNKFYYKGALSAFLLDFSISNCSAGSDNLIKSLNRYIKQKGKIFNEKEFIDDFLHSTCLKEIDLDISDEELSKKLREVVNMLGYEMTEKKVFITSDISYDFYLKDYYVKDGRYILSFDNRNSPIKDKHINVLKINNKNPTERMILNHIIYPPNAESINIEYICNNKRKIINLEPRQNGMFTRIHNVKKIGTLTSDMQECVKCFFE